jgi:hypothetical protein
MHSPSMVAATHLTVQFVDLIRLDILRHANLFGVCLVLMLVGSLITCVAFSPEGPPE